MRAPDSSCSYLSSSLLAHDIALDSGMAQRPARDVDPQKVIETVKSGVKATGYNEFSLLSLSCSDWLSLPAGALGVFASPLMRCACLLYEPQNTV